MKRVKATSEQGQISSLTKERWKGEMGQTRQGNGRIDTVRWGKVRWTR